jgi:hypothetical protein
MWVMGEPCPLPSPRSLQHRHQHIHQGAACCHDPPHLPTLRALKMPTATINNTNPSSELVRTETDVRTFTSEGSNSASAVAVSAVNT